MVLKKIKKLITYFAGKVPELQEMEPKDILLGKVVLDIHRKRTKKEFANIPLFFLKQIHVIDHETAVEATGKRVEQLKPLREELMARRILTREVLAKHLPSISYIKVVKENDGSYIAYEGNGRLAALQQVFSPEDRISVEVEVYHFRNQKKILRRMNRVRRMNGLI
jgi:transcriptional regulator with PAS, ATPase and Fis domain